MRIIEPDAVVLDLKTVDIREAAIYFGLTLPAYADRNLSVCLLGFVNCLNSVDNHLHDRRVDRCIGADVFYSSLDIDVAHVNMPQRSSDEAFYGP